MPELLIELLSEEIPARMQRHAAEDLKRLVRKGLDDAGLGHGDARAFATPRRLTLVVEDLPERQPDRREERKGPRVGAPAKAIQGFLGSVGLDSIDQCEVRETAKGSFYFAVAEKRGRPTVEILRELVPEIPTKLPWPKSMRWGEGDIRWVRPLHSILCVFGGEVVQFSVDGLRSGDRTRGHRFMAPGEITVTGFDDYRSRLRDAYVVLDPAERRQTILEAARAKAEADGLTLIEDDDLLDEVTGLVEWPVVLMGRIDEAFMEVPPEVLTTAMRSHQKYFSCRRPDGSLAPRFVMVANVDAPDGGKAIVAGNERVLSARLADARFFWDQDRKRRLESRVDELAGRVFHAKLGSVRDKVSRIERLASELAEACGADAADAARAARLAKADLSTGMVAEFPELQGVMGHYYAAHDGEPEAVAAAIADHYAPQGPNDRCPTQPVAVAVALADKIDSLVGFWAIGEKPTGSKDPYALRRAALGVIRLIVENGLRIPLSQIFLKAVKEYESTGLDWSHTASLAAAKNQNKGGEGGFETAAGSDPHRDFAETLLDFFADRLVVHLRERGVRHDLVSAVFALGGEDDLVRLLARVEALEGFLATDDGASLLVAYRRAANILRIEEKRDGVSYDGGVEPALLVQDEERLLHDRFRVVGAEAEAALGREDFAAAMRALAGLRRPVDDFFDKVTVNCDDARLRENRLRLLSGIRGALGRVADFSRIEG